MILILKYRCIITYERKGVGFIERGRKRVLNVRRNVEVI